MNNYGIKGINADGSPSHEYCIFCFADGVFTTEMTMEEMIEYDLNSIKMAMGFAGKEVDVDATRELLITYLPTLRRWRSEPCVCKNECLPENPMDALMSSDEIS